MLNTRSTGEDDLSSIMVHIAQKQKYKKWNSQRAAISLCKRWAAFLFSFTQHLLSGSFFIHVQCAPWLEIITLAFSAVSISLVCNLRMSTLLLFLFSSF
jgi:hypothetical protein